MNKRCTVCNHPERPEIDRELIRGLPYRALAAFIKACGYLFIRQRGLGGEFEGGGGLAVPQPSP
jgi:hypothetical protein